MVHVIDRASFETIVEAAEQQGVELTIHRRINPTLESRNTITTLSGESLKGSTTISCPLGGVLLPLLWGLVLDNFSGDPSKIIIMAWVM
jgi:hypothetical protein